jgi:cation diffusion facilitator family transporter
MSEPSLHSSHNDGISAEAVREKKAAAGTSVVAAMGLTGGKLVIGVLTNSLGILSEALHSGLDLVAAAVTYFAVNVSDRPADRVHTYGHGKVENLSALFETLLLLVTCIWIIYEAVKRIFFTEAVVEATLWSFLVMTASIVIDVGRSKVLRRAAVKHNSQALEADALHFSTDIWSSSVVLVGLSCVWLGNAAGQSFIQKAAQGVIPVSLLHKADAVAALGVAGIVIYISYQLGRRTIAVLVDSAPKGTADKVQGIAESVVGVLGVTDIRVRQGGAETFVDMSIEVPRTATFDEAHRIATQVESQIRAGIPRSDAVVHIDPAARPGESVPEAVRAIAARSGLGVHSLHVHDIDQHVDVELHVEVPSNLTLTQAHELVSGMESDLRAELGPQTRVQSHLEPAIGKP